MGAALKMAQQMGFIENKTTGQRSSGGGSVEELKAQRYSVEDKSREYEEDDRKRRRGDRGYGGGATSTFNEKKVRYDMSALFLLPNLFKIIDFWFTIIHLVAIFILFRFYYVQFNFPVRFFTDQYEFPIIHVLKIQTCIFACMNN